MFEKQIEAGVKYLNKNYPGWLDQIDIDKLDMVSACNCVIGQVAGQQSYYDPGLGFTMLNYEIITDMNSNWRTHPNWNILKQEWTEKIKELIEFEKLQDEFHNELSLVP